MWCVAELNEDDVEKMEDLLATYKQPYDPWEPVVCLDEKPATPGREASRDSEYERCGTANVFCAVGPKAAGISPSARRTLQASSVPRSFLSWPFGIPKPGRSIW